jgi:hypothetical protein
MITIFMHNFLLDKFFYVDRFESNMSLMFICCKSTHHYTVVYVEFKAAARAILREDGKDPS